jgi:isocitrate dehydrogenase kinase/phosphatase
LNGGDGYKFRLVPSLTPAGTPSSAASALTDSRLAVLCAEAVQHAFGNYQGRFDEITRRARERFLAHDLKGSYADSAERLHLYGQVLAVLTTEMTELLGPRLRERSVWTAIKDVYSSFVAHSRAPEISQSFFNSLTRRVLTTQGVDQAIEFVDSDFDAPPTRAPLDLRRVYSGEPLQELISSALTDPEAGGFAAECWNELGTSVRLAAERVEAEFPGAAEKASALRLELINRAFYRGPGAYILGRALREGGDGIGLPLALCLRCDDERGVTLDAVLLGEADLSILFSYTRAYFRVNADCPHALVHALRQLMPRKRIADLYNEIGFNRHAKTEFYRDFIAHLNASTDRFRTAEGTPGMVMVVFTWPSYDVVFKVIKDRFDFPKDSTSNEVKRRYKLVFEHDRAGRLVEAHEFEHLRMRRNRFEPVLLEKLLRAAGETVRLEGDDVIIAHAYVERRIRPLNLFFAESDATQVAAAARDYGQAIKDLAVSNIFPGDLLTKNFGVTRRGRVVFYDYDELCFLTDCNFRDLPQPSTYEEEMAAEPWFSVRENDVFPEEFLNFLFAPGPARAALLERHADLFHPDFWRSVQQKIREGEILEVLPYRPERRLITAN